jgi:ribosomal protein L7/L12
VLQRRRGVDVLERLSQGTLVSDNYKELLGDDPTATLAALAYNVVRSKAMQIVLEKPIADALLLGAEGGERLAALERAHKEGFWDKLRLALQTGRGGPDAEVRRSALWVGNAAQALLKSGLIDRAERHPLAHSVVRRLGRSASAVEAWPAFDTKKAEALAALCRWSRELGVNPVGEAGDTTLERNLLRSISVSLAPDENRGPYRSATEWLHNLSLVCNEIQASSPSAFSFDEQLDTILRPIAEKLEPGVDGEYKSVAAPELALLLEALYALRDGERERVADPVEGTKADDLLRRTVSASHLYHHLGRVAGYEGINEVTAPALALCMLVCVSYEPSLSEPPATGGSLKGHAYALELFTYADELVASAFVDTLAVHGWLPFLLWMPGDQSRAEVVEPFVAGCLRLALADRERAVVLCTSGMLAARWPFVYRLLNGEQRPLDQQLQNVIKGETARLPITEVMQAADIYDPLSQVEYAWLLAAAVAGPPEMSSEVIAAHRATWNAGLQQVKPERWRQEILEWGGLYELAFALHDAGQPSFTPEHYGAGLVAAAEAVIKGETAAKRPPERVPTKLLNSSAESAAFGRICDLAAQSNWDIPEEFFALYGRALAESSLIWKVGLAEILEPMLKKRNAAGLRWLRGVLAEHRELLENNLSTMINLVRKDLEEHADDLASAILFEIGKMVGVVDVTATDHPRFEVYLLEVGDREAEVLEVIALHTPAGHRAAELIKRGPSVVVRGVRKEQADRLAQMLRAAGATPIIEPFDLLKEPVLS